MDKQTKKFVVSIILFSIGFSLLLFLQYLRHKTGDYNYPPLTKALRYPALFIFAFLFLIYWLFIKAQNSYSNTRFKGVLFIWFFLLGIFLCYVFPIFSVDLYEYISRGRILSIYHANPYLHPPSDFPHDAYFDIIFWKYQPTIYGPVWIYSIAFISGFTQNSIFFSQFFVKFFVLIFHTLLSLFIYKLAGELKLEKPHVVSLAYLVNPFVLIMGLMEGHSDTVMICFLLGSILLLYKKRFYSSFFLLALSVLTKFLPIILVPFYLMYMYYTIAAQREFFKKALVSCFVMAVTIVAMYKPLWGGFATFSALTIVGTGFDSNTFPYVGYKVMSFLMPNFSPLIFRYISYAIFAILYLAVILFFAAGKNKEQGLINSIFIIFTAYILFGSFQLGAWYIMWILPFLLLSKIPLKYSLCGLLSFASLISFWKRISLLIIIMVLIYGILLFIRRRRIYV